MTVSQIAIDTHNEWLEADGLGGFSSGTTAGVRTRRYHALLMAAARPPADRFVLVNGSVAWLETPHGRQDLIAQHYAPGVTTVPALRLVEFRAAPWPTFRYVGEGRIELLQELIVERGSPCVLVRFVLLSGEPCKLTLRPLLSGRDFHHLHHENPGFNFTPEVDESIVTFRPYPGVPSVRCWSNGSYRHAPDWYRNFRYSEEAARGLDSDEDLATPGEFEFELSVGRSASLLLAADTPHAPGFGAADAARYADDLVRRESSRREGFASSLLRAADAYLVRRADGYTIIAGYPWFGDWGRDTFIALRGLCLASGRLREARDILLEWAGAVSEGMLPNRFADQSDETPEYNSVDASLWYVIAAAEFLGLPAAHELTREPEKRAIREAMVEIMDGYARGTRFGIRRDADGLLSAGAPGVQLTWMDAKVGDFVVTPRIGKPVEVQALWLNALYAVRGFDARFEQWLQHGTHSFVERFWNVEVGALYDVVDVDHQPGKLDASLRPNQVFAAGGLPYCPLSPEQARSVLNVVEGALLTPLGLRSLAPGSAGYAPRYEGGVWSRDTAYHQGTVWPWLMGAFVEAWVKARGATTQVKHEARARFVAPLLAHRASAGVGHVCEVADAEAPFTPRGCPFQAWSVSELLRLELGVLAPGG
ncbi:MAG: amylo-alpha-1,6-glucosidase [Polyangiaceae bacterium]